MITTPSACCSLVKVVAGLRQIKALPSIQQAFKSTSRKHQDDSNASKKGLVRKFVAGAQGQALKDRADCSSPQRKLIHIFNSKGYDAKFF